MENQPETEAISQNSTTQKYIQRNYRWNFTVNTLDGAFFWFGTSFFTSEIILTLFVSHFTRNPIIIGMLGFLGWGGVFLPQIFIANAVEHAPLKKFFPMTLGFFLERLPIILLAPVVFLLTPYQPILTLVVFFALYTWHNVGAGVIIVGWQDMIAKVIPVKKRGQFFGISNFIGNGAGILGALIVPLVLARFTFPLGFVYCFAVTGVFFFLSWVSLSLTREPVDHTIKPPISQKNYLRSLPEVLRKDHNFRTYLLAQIMFSLSSMATGFLAVYSVKTWNLPDAQASGFIIAMQIGLTLANLFFGFLADRKGHKLSLEICWMLNILALILAVMAPNPWWFFPIFLLIGAVSAGTILSGLSIVYEFTNAETRPTYIGLANTIPGIVVAVAPLIGGGLARIMGYRSMFIFSVIFGVISWVLLRFLMHEPRKMKSSA
jgi:MFS family permease